MTNKQALYNKEDDTVLLLGSKRRKSLLGILSKQQQQPTETNKIHLGQVQSSHEIRRAFSMGSSSAPISNLFRKQSKKNPKRASVFSLHDHAFIQTLPSSQDCLLRHVAALSLQPLLDNAVLDTKSSPPAHHPSVLWGKLMTHIKAKNMNEHRIFGVPLSVVVDRDKERTRTKPSAMTRFDFSTGLTASFSENASIPIFIKSLITTILQTDSIDKLNDQTLSEQSISEVQRRLLANQSPIQLAALLKRYLRELPEPLLTFGLYKLFIQCGKMDNSKHLLHIACCMLPKPNRDTMLMIFCCLKWIGGFSETNRMDICNLARVIAPSVLYSSPPHTCDGELRQGTHDEILVIENLIKYSDDMSMIPPDLILLPIQTDAKKNGQRRLSWIPGKNK
ncbi:hypothetical protein RO3G_05843 [Rhizopus delemar RA 99-880]|uniref:Rho-GAP domain-containing protein n=1 Tax=Rhizopus delemar (strain RA 99-880 / ATCC MYA-4621 / FGSC 9543 / NRRL 43880) TaxID=246409 RepID=I1BY58_RHIO9|nr:hypothetical protein RO3G_05843 [Rhizopus delemar RA 99-880]|eukprot:EIE81138.1 hypothetical protein RO3G_05843 [Rhizopus delemar RA 99-880]